MTQRLALSEQQDRLSDILVRMGALAEASSSDAIQAVCTGDENAATSALSRDKRIDALDSQVEEIAVRLLALQQPMARDLRVCIGSMRIAASFERIGDQAKNLAKRARTLPIPPLDTNTGPLLNALRRIGAAVVEQIRDATTALARNDLDIARQVLAREGEEIDSLYDASMREAFTAMVENPHLIAYSTHLLLMAKKLERAGDHCCHIAETVIYIETGERAP